MKKLNKMAKGGKKNAQIPAVEPVAAYEFTTAPSIDINIQYNTDTCGYTRVTWDAQPNYAGYMVLVENKDGANCVQQDVVDGVQYNLPFLPVQNTEAWLMVNMACGFQDNKTYNIVIRWWELIDGVWVIHNSTPAEIKTLNMIGQC